MQRQRGFAALELLLIVVAVSLMGYVGYAALNNANRTTADKGKSVVAAKMLVAPQVSKASDLTTAQAVIESAVVDNTHDTAQLDADLASF